MNMTEYSNAVHSQEIGASSTHFGLTPNKESPETIQNPETGTQKHNVHNSQNNFEHIDNESQDYPLKHLTVYVEIFSDKANISETAYKYLRMLGAKVEKRMNKKCNLVIWKDGAMKTVKKAKKYQVPIVNSLWLEECIDKNECADFARFEPHFPVDKDWPFFAVQSKKRKREFINLANTNTVASANDESSQRMLSLECNKTKKRKISKSKDKQAEKRVEIRLSKTFPQRKPRTKSRSTESRRKSARKEKGSRQRKKSRTPSLKLGTLHWRIMKLRKPKLGPLEAMGMGIENEKVEKSPTPTPSVSNSGTSLDIEGILANRQQQEESNRIRDMIMRYATAPSPVRFETLNLFSDQDTDIGEERANFYQESHLLDSPNLGNNSQRSNYDLSECSERKENQDHIIPQEPIEVFPLPAEFEVCEQQTEEEKNVKITSQDTPEKWTFDEKQDGDMVQRTCNSETPQTKAASSVDKSFATPGCPTNTAVKDIDAFMNEEEPEGEKKEEEKIEEEQVLNPIDLNSQFESPVKVERGRKKEQEKKKGKEKEKDNRCVSENKRVTRSSVDKSVKNKQDTKPQERCQTPNPRKGKNLKEDIKLRRTLTDFGFVCKPAVKNENKMEIETTLESLGDSLGGAHVLFSSSRKSDLLILEGFCEKFGLKYLNDETNNAKSLHMLVLEGDSVNKNYKVALAMALGKPVIKEGWVLESLKQGTLLNYKDYILDYDKEARKALLKKIRFFIDKELEEMPVNGVNAKDITTLIEAAGGSTFHNKKACDFVVMRKTTKKKSGVPTHVKAITSQWIIDSVVEGKLMNTEHFNYTIF